MSGGTNKLVLTRAPTPTTPALNCRGVLVSVNLTPELSMLSAIVTITITVSEFQTMPIYISRD